MPEEIQKAKKAIEKKWKKHAVTGKHFLAVGFTVQKVPDTMLSDKERTTIDDNMASNNVCQVPLLMKKMLHLLLNVTKLMFKIELCKKHCSLLISYQVWKASR